MEIEIACARALLSGNPALHSGCGGTSPAAREYRQIVAPGVANALFERRNAGRSGWQEVARIAGRYRPRRASIPLPGDLVRYEIRSRTAGRLEYRVGYWKLAWDNGAVTRLEPVEEILTYADKPWFRDVTGAAFAASLPFTEQLARGIPYWRLAP